MNLSLETKRLLFEDFESRNYDKILELSNKLTYSKKQVFDLYYGINEEYPLTNKEISTKLNLNYKNVNRLLNLSRKYIRENLIEKLKDDSVIYIKNMNFLISYLDKNEYKNKKFILDDRKIVINKEYKDCLLAKTIPIKKFLSLKSSVCKKCEVFYVDLYENDQKVKTNILIRDLETKKFYKRIEKNKDGSFIFDNIEKDEVVCYAFNDEICLENKFEKLKNNLIVSYEDRNFIETINLAMKLLNSNNEDDLYTANLYLGKSYFKINKLYMSKRYLKNALKYKDTYYIHYKLVKILSYEKKFDEALKEIEECEKLDHLNFEHVIKKAVILYQKGLEEEAIKVLDQYLEKDNNYRVRSKKVELLFDMGRYNETLKEIKKFDKYYNENRTILEIYGEIQYLKGNIKQAFEIFESITKGRTYEDNYSSSYIGHFFHKLGNKELANRYYSKVNMYRRLFDSVKSDNEKFVKDKYMNESIEMPYYYTDKVSYSNLKNLIIDMEKKETIKFYDVYEVNIPGGIYTIIDGKIIEYDYVIVHTLPFTKKIIKYFPFEEKANYDILDENKYIDADKEKKLEEKRKKLEKK